MTCAVSSPSSAPRLSHGVCLFSHECDESENHIMRERRSPLETSTPCCMSCCDREFGFRIGLVFSFEIPWLGVYGQHGKYIVLSEVWDMGYAGCMVRPNYIEKRKTHRKTQNMLHAIAVYGQDEDKRHPGTETLCVRDVSAHKT